MVNNQSTRIIHSQGARNVDISCTIVVTTSQKAY